MGLVCSAVSPLSSWLLAGRHGARVVVAKSLHPDIQALGGEGPWTWNELFETSKLSPTRPTTS